MTFKKSLAFSFLNTIIPGALAYLFQLYILTFYETKDIADYIITISILNIILAPSMAINLYFTRDYNFRIHKIISIIYDKILIIILSSILFTLIGLIYKNNIIISFGLVLLGYCASLSFISAFVNKDFKYILKFNLLSNVSKISIIIIISYFVDKKFSIIIVSIVLSYLIGILFSKNYLIKELKKLKINGNNINYSLLLYFIISFFCISIITNIDVIFIRYFIDKEFLDNNSKIFLFGKIIFYCSISISTVLFSFAVKDFRKKIFIDGIIFSSVIFLISLILVLFLNYLNYLDNYGDIKLIIIYILYMYPISIIFLIENYLLLSKSKILIIGTIINLLVIFSLNINTVNNFLYIMGSLNFILASFLVFNLISYENK